MKELPCESQKLPRGEFVIKKWKVGDVGKTFADFNGVHLYVITAHLNRATGGGDEANEHFNRGGFPSCIWAKHHKKFTLADGQTNVINSGQITKFFNQVGKFDHGFRLNFP